MAPYEVLSLVCENSNCRLDSLRLLARLATSSNFLRKTIKAIIRQQVSKLLAGALKSTTRYSTPEEVSKALPGISWLAKQAGTKSLSSQVPFLLTIPHLPASIASALLDAQMRPSQANLVAAARSRIPGIEVFVLSHMSGLPAATEAVCCAEHCSAQGDARCSPRCTCLDRVLRHDLPFLPPDEFSDLLYLAFNLPAACPAAVHPAVYLLQYVNDPSKGALYLLSKQHKEEQRLVAAQAAALAALKPKTSCRRGKKKCKILPDPAQSPEELQQLYSQQNEKLKQRHLQQQQLLQQRLQQLRQQLAAPGVLQELIITAATRRHANLVYSLLTLPEAKALDAATVASLLRSAIKTQYSPITLVALTQLPAASELSSTTTASLLELCISHRFYAGLHPIWQLPSFNTQTAADALESAMHHGWEAAGTFLLSMHRTQQIGSGRLLQLLQLAMQYRNSSYVKQLCESAPSAQGIGASSVHQLLLEALQSSMDYSSLHSLLQLYGAQFLQAKPVAELLLCAINMQASTDFVGELANLPAADYIPAANMGTLLHASLHRAHMDEDYSNLHMLCSMPAAQKETMKGCIVDLLRAAMLHEELNVCVYLDGSRICVSEADVLEDLCGLPAAQQLDVDALTGLIAQAVSLQHSTMLLHLSRLPAAPQLPAATLQRLLNGVVAAGKIAVMSVLCTEFPAADAIPTGVIANFLRLSIHQSTAPNPIHSTKAAHAVHVLCKLKGAQELSGTAVASLLITAGKLADQRGRQMGKQIQDLCTLPGASQISTRDAAAVLELCVQHEGRLGIEPLQCIIMGLPAVKLLNEDAVMGTLDRVQEGQPGRQRLRPVAPAPVQAGRAVDKRNPTLEELLYDLLQMVRVKEA